MTCRIFLERGRKTRGMSCVNFLLYTHCFLYLLESFVFVYACISGSWTSTAWPASIREDMAWSILLC